MKDPRLDATTPDARKLTDAHDELSADFHALRRESGRELPPLETFLRTAPRRPRTWEEHLMAASSFLTRRPWGIAAFAGALAVIALLVVPFSYERTTGHTLTLAVSGAKLDAAHLRSIAMQMKQLTHAKGVAVHAEDSNGAMAFTLSSTVPNETGVDVDATAKAFAAQLNHLGYTATASVAPIKERVSGSVYAYARDRVITIDVANKTPAQIENEIRQGLADAGVTGAEVSVSQDIAGANEKLKLMVEAKKQVSGPNDPAIHEPMPQLVFQKNGAPLGDGHGFTVREEMRRTPDGATLTLIVNDGDKSTTIEIPHSDTAGDAAIKSQVETALHNAGIAAEVSVTDGRVMLHKN